MRKNVRKAMVLLAIAVVAMGAYWALYLRTQPIALKDPSSIQWVDVDSDRANVEKQVFYPDNGSNDKGPYLSSEDMKKIYEALRKHEWKVAVYGNSSPAYTIDDIRITISVNDDNHRYHVYLLSGERLQVIGFDGEMHEIVNGTALFKEIDDIVRPLYSAAQ